MKSWTLLLLPFALASGFAGFAAVPPPIGPSPRACEGELQSVNSSQSVQISPADFYMRLVLLGLKDQALGLTDLQWALTQEQPCVPTAQGRTLENFQLKRGFHQVLRQVTKANWREIHERLRTELNLQTQAESKISNARENTRHLPPWIPLDQKPDNYFVASTGEVFFVFSHFMQGTFEIFNPLQKTSISIAHIMNSEIGDFYETSSGDVYFATIVGHGLTVVNVRTGNKHHHILEDDQWDKYGDFRKKSKWRPLLFEQQEGWIFKSPKLKVALVQHGTFSFKLRSEPMPIPIVDVKSGKHVDQVIPGGGFEYRRMSDGNLYAYGLSIVSKFTTNAIVHNITLNRQLSNAALSIDYERAKELKAILSLGASGSPHFLLHDSHILQPKIPTETFILELRQPEKNHLALLPEFLGARSVQEISDGKNEPLLAGLLNEPDGTTTLLLKSLESGKLHRVRLDTADERLDFNVVTTPQETYFVIRSLALDETYIYELGKDKLNVTPYRSVPTNPVTYFPSEKALYAMVVINHNIEFVPLWEVAP